MQSPTIHSTDLLELLSQMIEIESVNPGLSTNGSGEKQIAELLGNYMKKMGLEVHVQEPEKGRMNAIGIWRGSGGGNNIILNGHIDTVGAEGMTIDPFKPTFTDGKLYGRGSMDMKSGVAAQIIAVKALMDAGVQLKGDVVIACVADEENLSIGTEAFVKEYSADAAIVTEPTDLEIVIAHKGFVWIQIDIEGKAAHGSRPEVGIDAILKAGKVLAELEVLEREILPQYTHPLLGRASLHASTIQGGSAISIYPDHCRITVERRTLPGETIETVSAEIETIIQKLHQADPDFKGEAHAYFERKPLEVSSDSEIVQLLSKQFIQTMKHSPTLNGIGFWTDAAILNDAGIPTVVFGPTGKGLHGAVEYVEFDSVVQTAEILAKTIAEFCK